MDTSLIAAVAAASQATVGSDAWREVVERLRNKNAGNVAPEGGEVDSPVGAPALPTPNEVFSQVLESYYTKVGKRADFSFYAALIAAVLGYLTIAAGILVGIYNSDDIALGVAATGAGVFSQVLAFMFFRNRAEERKMMIQVLADLRIDAERGTRAIRAVQLIESIQQQQLRDNLAAAVAVELTGTSTDVAKLHSALHLFGSPGPTDVRSRPADPGNISAG